MAKLDDNLHEELPEWLTPVSHKLMQHEQKKDTKLLALRKKQAVKADSD